MAAPPPRGHHILFVALDAATVASENLIPDQMWQRTDRALHVRDDGSVAGAMRDLLREVAVGKRWRGAGLRLAAARLHLEAQRLVEATPVVRYRALHPAVEAACRSMDGDLGQAWPLSLLAGHGEISVSYFVRRFRKDMGFTPHAYLAARRIQEAQQALAMTDVSVTQLAMDLGFASSQHFARAFQRQVGQAPTAYRRALQAACPHAPANGGR